MDEFVALVDMDTQGQREMWVTFGRLEVLCGAAEAKTMVENDELETREHPSRKNAKLYLWVEEWREQTRRTEHGRRARQSKDVEENDEFDADKKELMPDHLPAAQPLPLQYAQSSQLTPLTKFSPRTQADTETAESDG